eukprot:644476-Amphidinium_carterae.1
MHVRRMCLHAACEERQLVVQREESIKQYRDRHVAVMLSSVLEAVPGLQESSDHLHYIPHNQFCRFHVQTNQDLKAILSIATWAQQHAKQNTAMKYLEYDWHRKNIPIQGTLPETYGPSQETH